MVIEFKVAAKAIGMPPEKVIPKINWGRFKNLFEKGYRTIKNIKTKEIYKDNKLSCDKRTRAKLIKKKVKSRASFDETFPAAIGLDTVLCTFASISLSIKSLITQPADLITNAPKLKITKSLKLTSPLEATRRAINVGHNRSKVPMGLSKRIK